MLLGERLVEVLLELLTHANTGVGADKLDPGSFAVAAHLAAGQVDGTVVLVVLDGVAQNVHQQPLQVQRATNECGVFDLGAVGHRDAALGGGALHRLADAVFQLYHVERAAFQQDLAGFQFAHVQHFVHQLQQQSRSIPDLAAALSLFGQVLAVMVADLHHAADAVDGCADVVAHALQKLGLGAVGALGFAGGVFQLLLVALLPAELLLLVDMLEPPADHDDDEQHHGVGQQREQQVRGRGVQCAGQRHVGVDVVVPPALQHAVDPLAVAGTGPHAGHLAAVGVLPDAAQNRHVVDVLPGQAFAVGGNDAVAAGDHQRFLGAGVVAFQQVLDDQVVVGGIFGAGMIINDDHARLVGAAVGSQVHVGAIVQPDAGGVGLNGELGGSQHGVHGDVPAQGGVVQPVSAVLPLDDAMLVHQDDAGQPLLVGIAAQVVGVQRGLVGQGNLVLDLAVDLLGVLDDAHQAFGHRGIVEPVVGCTLLFDVLGGIGEVLAGQVQVTAVGHQPHQRHQPQPQAEHQGPEKADGEGRYFSIRQGRPPPKISRGLPDTCR